MAKEEPIKLDPKNKGDFTAWVKKNMPGSSVCAAASKVMKNKGGKYSPKVVKQAVFANNFGCKMKKKK